MFYVIGQSHAGDWQYDDYVSAPQETYAEALLLREELAASDPPLVGGKVVVEV